MSVTKASLFTPISEGEIGLEGQEEEIDIEMIEVGDLVKVTNGNSIPADGNVVAGVGFVNESMLTGESKLLKKEIDSEVYGGSILENGNVIVKISRSAEDSSLNQIMKMVENAQASKAPIQALADRISKYFVPFIILMASVTWIFWFIVIYTHPDPTSFMGNENTSKFVFAFKFGIATLVIACPCALGLATPTAVMVGTGIAANLGILIKGGDIL